MSRIEDRALESLNRLGGIWTFVEKLNILLERVLEYDIETGC